MDIIIIFFCVISIRKFKEVLVYKKIKRIVEMKRVKEENMHSHDD